MQEGCLCISIITSMGWTVATCLKPAVSDGSPDYTDHSYHIRCFSALIAMWVATKAIQYGLLCLKSTWHSKEKHLICDAVNQYALYAGVFISGLIDLNHLI